MVILVFILSLFCQNFGENEISGKRVLSVFKYSSYLPLLKKSEKTNDQFLGKTPNRQFDRSLTVQTAQAYPNCWNLIDSGITFSF